MEIGWVLRDSPSVLRFFLVLILTTGLCAAETGYQALKVVRQAQGDSVTRSLLQINGEAGDPQPVTWTIVFQDATARGGFREFQVSGGAITSERAPLRDLSGRGAFPKIPFGKLKVDSDIAFRVAERAAVKNRIGFHTANYTLRMSEEFAGPIWVIRLYDAFGAHIGTAKVSTESAALLEFSEVDAAARVRAEKSETSAAKDDEEIGGLIGRIRDFGDSAAETVRDTSLNVAGSVQEFLTGERTIGETEPDY